MKNLILLLLIAFVFTGCLSSSLHVSSSKKLNLHFEKNTLTIGTKTQKQNSLFFTDVEIKQYTSISNDGNTLFCEDAETDSDYEFSETEVHTFIYAVNEYGNYETVYSRESLQLVQVELKNNAYINVLIQAENVQEYSFVYGFSNEEFINIAKTIQTKDTKITLPKFEAITFNKDSKPQTNWNTHLIYYTPLIKFLNIRGGA